MLSEFLKDYLPIILFLIIALGLSCAFVVINLIVDLCYAALDPRIRYQS